MPDTFFTLLCARAVTTQASVVYLRSFQSPSAFLAWNWEKCKKYLGQSNLFTTLLFILGCWTPGSPEECETTLWLFLSVFLHHGHVCQGVVSSTFTGMTISFQVLVRHRKLRSRLEAYQKHPMLAWDSWLLLFAAGGRHGSMCLQNIRSSQMHVQGYYCHLFCSWRLSSFPPSMHDYDYFYFLFRCLHEAKVRGRTHYKLFVFLCLLAPGGEHDYPANSYR